MSDGPWYRTNPVWNTALQSGVGPGLQAPDYSTPEPPQPGEAPALLPGYAGSHDEQARDNRHAIKHGDMPRGQQRQPPFLVRSQPLTYSGVPSQNVLSLGKPDDGYRWVIRQLAILPGDTISSGGGAGLTCHFYVGQLPPPGQLPALTDWIHSITTTATVVPPQDVTFSSNIHQVQKNQNLVAYVVGSTGGYTSVVMARVIQIPDTAEKLVSSV